MEFIFYLAILLFSVVLHEVSHGYVALALGDTTAKDAGRLTLNPLPHLDPFGSIILPLILAIPMLFGQPSILIGWAKPVPYNPRRLRYSRWGPALVGAAGPAVNIAVAVVFGLIIRFGTQLSGVLPGGFMVNFFGIASAVALLNLVLALFNLVPIPPLDGSKVLFSLLPQQFQNVRIFLEHYGMLLLLIFIFFFAQWLIPLVLFLFRLISGTLPVF